MNIECKGLIPLRIKAIIINRFRSLWSLITWDPVCGDNHIRIRYILVSLNRSFVSSNPISSKHHPIQWFLISRIIVPLANNRKWLESYRESLEVRFRNELFFCRSFFSSPTDRLVTQPLFDKDSATLPSPEDLKYKVLIRVWEANKECFINVNEISWFENIATFTIVRELPIR